MREMMGNPKASSVAPLTPVAGHGAVDFGPEQASEQPRDFHFAVTWVTLFAHLELIHVTGPRTKPANTPSTLALVPVVASAPLVEQRSDRLDNAAWEMVVPKMVRSESGTFAPAESRERRLL
jgi:hypothetical protein